MTASDLAAVQILADAIHIDHPEDAGIFAERLSLYPQGCLTLDEHGVLSGYAISHPWHLGMPPTLNAPLGAIPRNATTYYVHDVALVTGARGKGHASSINDHLARHAQGMGFRNLSLVAVNNSQKFWKRLGFRATHVPGLQAKLLTYGPDAVLMMRNLAEVYS